MSRRWSIDLRWEKWPPCWGKVKARSAVLIAQAFPHLHESNASFFSIRACPTELFSEEWEACFPLILFIPTAWLQLSCCVELSQPLRDEWVDPVGPEEHNGRSWPNSFETSRLLEVEAACRFDEALFPSLIKVREWVSLPALKHDERIVLKKGREMKEHRAEE